MRKIKTIGILFLIVIQFIIVIPFHSCEPDDTIYIVEEDSTNNARKPNIYIYPEQNIQLNLELSFPIGGRILVSIPDYGDGWNVSVDTNGLINDSYSYLFYESYQPDIWQRDNGWIVEKTELESFFRENMINYGFDGQEIEDFIEYWIPRLDRFSYYSIFPQTKELINEAIEFSFSIEPDNILRLFYVIKGFDEIPSSNLTEPVIDISFEREAYDNQENYDYLNSRKLFSWTKYL